MTDLTNGGRGDEPAVDLSAGAPVHFTDPPLDEVAVGFQFHPIVGFLDVHAALVWQRLRAEYPKTLTQPRIDIPIETFTSDMPSPFPEFRWGTDDDHRRLFLISENDERVLQIQDSQIMQNWRRRQNDYPHLDAVVEGLWSGLDALEEVLAAEHLDPPRARQLELSYFDWDYELPFETVLKPAAALALPSLGGAIASDQTLTGRWVVDHDGGRKARLTFEASSAWRVDLGRKGTRLSCVYRCPYPDGPTPSRDELAAEIQRGRATIDSAFIDLTTDEARTKWGQS